MINIIVKDIVNYRVEVPLIWFIGFTFIVYKLGFYSAKRKYSNLNVSQNNIVDCVVPYTNQHSKEVSV
jgi:hypothetical protein